MFKKITNHKKIILIIIGIFLLSFTSFVSFKVIYNGKEVKQDVIEEPINNKEETKVVEDNKPVVEEPTVVVPETKPTTPQTTKPTTNPTTPTPPAKPAAEEPAVVVPVEKTMKEKNQDLIADIKRIYGYKVSYGTEEFWYGGVASTKLTDEAKANKALNEIKTGSAIFPTGFFRTFQGYNGFRIILFEHIEGAAGVASYEFGDDNYIALDINSGFLGRVFYHETFHIMERYISYKTYGQTNPFNTWNSLNPSTFTYGEKTGRTYTAYDLNEYGKYTTPSSISFVSEYAKTRANEDRAEMFADLMFRGIKKEYMQAGFGINEKAKSLALTLRNFFPNSKGARWERFITW